MHNRELVVRLQNAHADHIESIYSQMMRLAGNPEGIEILKIGETKVFLSDRNRLENRAIFTGNETLEELQEVTACFDRKGVDGFFEINPANFYRSNPFSWNSEMVPALIDLGYQPGDMRCVWYLDEYQEQVEPAVSSQIKQFTYKDVDEYIKAKLAVEPVEKEKIESEIINIRQEFTERWTYYIGYEGEKPVSISKLFITDKTGYLAWGYTMPEYRRRGHHKMQLMSRVRYAFDSGCDVVFTVTDFNVPSSLSLQKVGFRLAYNYLLMEKRAATQ